jgi:hypothetical protein
MQSSLPDQEAVSAWMTAYPSLTSSKRGFRPDSKVCRDVGEV